MRPSSRWLSLLLAPLTLAACGGGGLADTALAPVPTASSAKADLSGQILSVDGRTTALGDIMLGLRETSDTAVTAADGSFDFGAVPTGALVLDLLRVPVSLSSQKDGADDATAGQGSGNDDNGAAGQGSGNDDDATEDEVEDGEDASDDSASVFRVQDQERVQVRLRIQDGQIQSMECVRDENQEREIEQRMIRTAGNADPDMKGKTEVESRQDRERLKVRVEYATEGTDLELWAIDPEGNEELLGTRTVGVDGECRWTFDTSDGTRLPFGLRTVVDLEGYTLEVRDADSGEVLLSVVVPALPAAGMGGPDDHGEHGPGHE